MKKLIQRSLFVLMFLPVIALACPVDLNTASKEDLMTLKFIGEAKAKAILEYREKTPFKSVDEITVIKGVGEATLEKNQDCLTVSKKKAK